MVTRGMFVGLFLLSVGCGEALDVGAETPRELARSAQAVSVNAQKAVDWANNWISEVDADSTRLAENVYTTDSPALERFSATVQATNRSVCGTLVTQLMQKSIPLVANDFYKSFNKAMDSCDVGTVGGVQKGTSSPNAAQYRYKIANCASTGKIRFQARTTLSAIEIGDVLAVTYPERTDISGHVMLVRSVPVADPALPAGPSGSTAYAVEIIDSTADPHGTSTTYPDWRGGSTGQGLGHGTFVLYTNSSDEIIASRWSPTDPTQFSTTDHPLAVGGLL